MKCNYMNKFKNTVVPVSLFWKGYLFTGIQWVLTDLLMMFFTSFYSLKISIFMCFLFWGSYILMLPAFFVKYKPYDSLS